jgi:pyruvate formate lyase activating enzyme
MKEAQLWEALSEDRVQCHLCAHQCIIPPDGRGICRVRENRDGILYTLVYEKLIAQHVDPIEKKPLFHVMPGSRAYSIATV